MNITRFRAAPRDSNRALIDFLALHRACSRRKAKALLDRRAVFINGRRIWMAHHRLQAGDLVDIAETPESVPSPEAALILFQDSDYLIAHKPAGILANGPHSFETRLQTALHAPALTAVHRLDRGTSGCLLFARHAAARQRVIPLFAGRKIQKIYHALVAGQIREPRFSISKPLEGQAAMTKIRVLDANHQASHLRILISTGRTHQIRKHLMAIGHPILGDSYYAPRREISPAEQRLTRPMLHAFQLAFIQPITGVSVRGTAPLPDDFRQGLAGFHLR